MVPLLNTQCNLGCDINIPRRPLLPLPTPWLCNYSAHVHHKNKPTAVRVATSRSCSSVVSCHRTHVSYFFVSGSIRAWKVVPKPTMDISGSYNEIDIATPFLLANAAWSQRCVKDHVTYLRESGQLVLPAAEPHSAGVRGERPLPH